MSSVLYSYALDAEGRRRSINDRDAPKPFQCGDCDGDMVARRGKVRTWHYAHKAKVVCEPKPDPDNALHRFAQDIIFESFNRHRGKEAEYKVGVKCAGLSSRLEYYGAAGCDNPVAKNAAESGAQIYREHMLVPNTRSDLVIELPNGKALILEVVNTHAPEDATREQYREAGYPTFIQKVSWESLDELHVGFIADDTINVPAVRCGSCREERRRMEEEQALRQEALQMRMRTIDAAAQKLVRKRSPTPRFRPWYQIYKANWGTNRPVQMYPKTQRPVFANAIILTELGFIQRNASKPHLFSYQVSGSPRIILYADLGGSDVVSVYKDTAAMLYVFTPGMDDDPEIEQYVIDRFGEILQREGVNVRTGFESSAYIEQVQISSERYVSKEMLDALVKWDKTCRACQKKAVSQGVCRLCGTIQNSASSGMQNYGYDTLHNMMTDYPGKPVRSPRKWFGDDYE